MSFLLRKLKTALPELKCLEHAAYTTEELAEIIRQRLDDCGVELEDFKDTDQDTDRLLLSIIKQRKIQSAAGTKELCRELVRAADYTAFVPVISMNVLEKLEGGENHEMRKMGR